MRITLITLFLALSFQALADTITARYPDYNHSKSGACKDAKRHVKLKASDECRSRVSGTIDTECLKCTKKVRFNTPTWTCSGRATYECAGSSVSQDESDKKDKFGSKAIRGLRGKVRGKGGQSPCLQFPNGSACRQWKKQYKAVGGVRN